MNREAANRRDEGLAHREIGRLCEQQGRRREAREAFEAAAVALEEVGDRAQEGIARAYLARVLVTEGETGAAVADAERAEALLRAAAGPATLAEGLACLAVVLGRTGAAARSRILLAEADARVPYAHAEARAAVDRARALLGPDRPR